MNTSCFQIFLNKKKDLSEFKGYKMHELLNLLIDGIDMIMMDKKEPILSKKKQERFVEFYKWIKENTVPVVEYNNKILNKTAWPIYIEIRYTPYKGSFVVHNKKNKIVITNRNPINIDNIEYIIQPKKSKNRTSNSKKVIKKNNLKK